MLKFKMQLSGEAQALANVKGIDKAIINEFREGIVESAENFRDKAKEVLHGSVNPEYSTGRLESSIRMSSNPKKLTASAGPDMRIAPYAEWVEYGHSMRDGRWWPGHHYMMRAWRELAKSNLSFIVVKTAGALKYYAKTVNKRVQHLRTRKIVGSTR